MKLEKIDILFIRIDRIGDLVLSLPVDQLPCFRSRETHWLISRGLGFILEHAQPSRSFSEMEKKFSFRHFFDFYRWLKQVQPNTAVTFYAPWWVGFALFLARVPLRVGRYSQWHSFLFFNKGLRQKRSLSEKHELDYNFDLARLCLKQDIPAEIDARLKLRSKAGGEALKKHGLQEKSFYVVHPGMGGSALNWSIANYISLIEQLSTRYPVAITGTKIDEAYLQPIKEKLSDAANVIWLDNQLSSKELIGVLQLARGVVAPSTGVVHIAASCGTPTVGLYSPVLTESSKRWGPKGEWVKVLNAEKGHDPMSSIKVDSVLSSLQELEGQT